MKKLLYGLSGVTMVEIMIGIILLSLMILPSLNVIFSHTQSVTLTRDHAQAAVVAQSILEMCRSFRFPLIPDPGTSASLTDRQRTFEYRLKEVESYNKHVMNGIEYIVDPTSVSVEPSKNIKEPSQLPVLYFIKFNITYKDSNGKSNVFETASAISKRE